jgi:GTP-binding protein LepA
VGETLVSPRIRNFCIIAHIDHGKSTLADRFLELTGTVEKRKMRDQMLDMMELEREKGITIKMQPVRMKYTMDGVEYILNLIDTPGHVDFSYEVSRSLAAVEGVILLVDATKGIQAQTLANLYLALQEDLVIIPAVNKIDSPQAKTQEVKKEIAEVLGVSEDSVYEVSGKDGTNVEKLLAAVIEKVPPPKGANNGILRALIFDSKFDAFKGVITYVRVVDGAISPNEKISLLAQQAEGEAKEVGFFMPELVSSGELRTGEIGYIATGVKEPGKVRVGDTITKKSQITNSKSQIQPLSGYKEPNPVVFMSFYPESADDFDVLKDALAKLQLQDAALSFELESQEVLGRGFRCGFLGMLHAEIISERLKREFGLSLVISSPSVLYKVTLQDGKEVAIYSPQNFPQSSSIAKAQEPWIRLEVMTPTLYLGQVHGMFEHIRSEYKETKYFGAERLMLIYEVPLSEMLTSLYDTLKGVTQGYASLNYEPMGYREADLVRLDILLAAIKEEAFSQIVPRQSAYEAGKKMVEKLKGVLPKQQFAVAIQAVIEGKVIARETLSAMRKDVTGYLYGGDYTRKKKLLEKQKKGKLELKEKGRVRVPASVFLEVLKSR